MSDDQARLDTGQVDTSTPDQTPDVSLDNAVPIREAADLAGVTEKTIRRWIKNGRLHAVKLGGQYRITVADLERAKVASLDTTPQPVSTQRSGTGQGSPAVDMSTRLDTGQAAAPLDLRPLVDHLAALEGQVQQLTEAATVWQVRALQAEDQLKQLTAGEAREHAAQSTQDGPHEKSAADVADDAPAPWWQRWWRSLREGP